MQVLSLKTAFAIVTLALSGCSIAPKSAGPKPIGPSEVHVTMKEFSVAVDRPSVSAGDVKLIITNAGVITHELAIENVGAMDEPFESNGEKAEVENIAPGKTATLVWKLDKPGKYWLACNTKENNVDHLALGMKTELTVTAP